MHTYRTPKLSSTDHISVDFTSIAFVHPETAKRFLLDSLQLVAIVPRLSSEDGSKDPQNDGVRVKISSTTKKANSGKQTNRKEYCHAIVRLLVSDSVTKGHVMIAQSLRLYLRASLHSCEFVLTESWVQHCLPIITIP